MAEYRVRWRSLVCGGLLAWSSVGGVYAEDTESSGGSLVEQGSISAPIGADEARSDILTTKEWDTIDGAAARALAWLTTQQEADGSFPTIEIGEPGVTSLCLLAFMAHGHNPGEGREGERLDRAIDFILSCQKANGLVAMHGPEGPRITRDVGHEVGQTAVYNHAIASLALAEAYGMGQSKRAERMEQTIKKALSATLEMQKWPKERGAIDHGGWRYVDHFDADDADLSITGWQLMFLRSARNAGFDVPKKSIDDAVAYVRRCHSQEYGAMGYVAGPGDHRSRAMAGAGILALAHAGFHKSEEAKRSGDWLLQFTFENYNSDDGFPRDRYHYALFYCCQGMYQLGGTHWEQFYPRAIRNVLQHQQANGSWEVEGYDLDRPFGNSYTTALVLLSLATPNQMLPIFQR